MAAVWTFVLLQCIFLYQIPFITCQAGLYNTPILKIDVGSCNQDGTTAKFFDINKLACVDCSQNKTFQKASGNSCVCQPGYKYTRNFGGQSVTCEPCPAGEYASSTGYSCLKCPNGLATTGDSCAACTGTGVISPERDLLGNWYRDGTGNNTINCQTCAAGTQPGPDNTRCVKCTTVLPVTANNSCNCSATAGQTLTGGYCFPTSDLANIPSGDGPYKIPRTVEANSVYLFENLRAAYILCAVYRNLTACNVLSNLCVLTLYEYNNKEFSSATVSVNNACEMYFSALTKSSQNVPTLYYVTFGGLGVFPISGADVLQDDYLQTQYTFNPVSRIEYRLATYTLNGQYLGTKTVQDERIQLCRDTDNKMNAAFVFGTSFYQSCKITALDLFDQTKYPLRFYDLSGAETLPTNDELSLVCVGISGHYLDEVDYLEINQNGPAELFPTPVNILNYRSLDKGSQEINRGEMKDMQLFRRFFLVDNVGTITASGPRAQIVRYAKSIEINVELQTDTNQGVIFPPALKIEYGSVSLADAIAGAQVDISFKVDYTFTDTSYLKDFQIAVGVLSTLGVLYAGYRTWVWSKRSGRPSIDFPTIANFFFFCSGSLANVFFVITFGMAFYWFIFFKRQSVVYLVHPSESQLRDWKGLFGAAFALKFLEVAHMIFLQCIIDVFFIDWERSRGVVSNIVDSSKSREVPVSIWRTYFVANEWNEIQAVRKINKTFQVWAAVFFLVVVGFKNTTTMDPDGSVRKSSDAYKPEYSNVYRYALAVLVYLIIGIVQWIFFTFIYERFFEDKVRQFVDLCSISNISVFIMANAQYGHYIHGRSVHGKADTNMKEMFELMKKEEDDMCGKRGLLANTEQQTFIMALPRKLRTRYESVLIPAQLETAAAAAAGQNRGGRIAGTAMEKQVEAYSTINRFFSAFIDRSLKDMDYVIKDKLLLESIMDTEFDDTTETGVFFNDNGHSFDNVLFYGNEMTLLLFDVLTFCIVDLIFKNYVIAGVITYLLCEIVCMVRNAGGQKNLAKKTLVDDRFLI